MSDRRERADDPARAGRDPQGVAEAAMRREMARLSAQGEKIFGPGELAQGAEAGRAGRPAGDEAPGEAAPDAVEIWARRVGRGLGYAFALYLLWHLLSTYVLPR